MPGHITPIEAARIKRVRPEAVYAAIKSGRLQARCILGRYLIEQADLDRWEVVGHRPKKERRRIGAE